MFLFIRRNAVSLLAYTNIRLLTQSIQIQSHLQISKPVDPIFVEFAEILSPYENVEDRLLSIAMRIPKLQSLANNLLSRPSCNIDDSTVLQLVRAAGDLDRELAEWARQIPIKSSYTTVTRMKHSRDQHLSDSNFTPNHLHRYPNFYAARVWNSYRVYRLIIQSILFRASSFLGGQDQSHIENINRIMVGDICASVPFLLGYDFSELRSSNDTLPDESFLWPQSSVNKVTSSERTGKFSLIWPLYVACSVLSVPDTQRRWMRAQLRWIAETGEAQALLVQDSESRTLIGGPESFRFDCV